jgi:hypothetical protein
MSSCLTPAQIKASMEIEGCCPTPSNDEFKQRVLTLLANSSGGGGGGGSGDTFNVTKLTPDPAVFFDPMVIFTVTASTWNDVYWDTGRLGTARSAVFTQSPFALMVNEALTELWAIEGVVPNAQIFQRINIATNTSLESTTITGIDTNEQIHVAAMHPLTGQIYLATRRQPEADSLLTLYSLDVSVPGTAVATKIAESKNTYIVNSADNGMAIFPDGTCYLSSTFSGLRQVYKLNLATGDGETVYSANSSEPYNFENLNSTCRNSFFGTAVGFSGLAEIGYPNFGLLRNTLVGGATANAQVMLPPVSRKFYLGMPIYKIDQIDSSGALVGTQYLLEDGTVATLPANFPLQDFDTLEKPLAPASGVTGNLQFGAITTASFAKIVERASWTGNSVFISITNGTDVPVYISFDAFSNHIYVPPNENREIDLKSLNLFIPGDIFVKAIGSNPTGGGVYVSVLAGGL